MNSGGSGRSAELLGEAWMVDGHLAQVFQRAQDAAIRYIYPLHIHLTGASAIYDAA